MTETNYIVLDFTKSNGDKHSMKVSYPQLPAVGADVKALGEFLVGNEIFSFTDGVTLANFDGASVQRITEEEIGLN